MRSMKPSIRNYFSLPKELTLFFTSIRFILQLAQPSSSTKAQEKLQIKEKSSFSFVINLIAVKLTIHQYSTVLTALLGKFQNHCHKYRF